MEKSIRELAWNVDEPTYRADSAISYSTLSRFEREGWRKLDSLFDKIETPSLTFGSAVDTKLTDGDEAFNERFIVCDFPPLSDTLISITKFLHKNFHENHRKLSMIDDAEISRAALMFNYYANPKYENFRVKSIKENCDEYYSLLTLAGDKTVLSQDDYADVMACVNALKESDISKPYFSPNNPWDDTVEKHYQLKFKGEYKGIPIRCMADLIIVNHDEGTIQMIDLKTTKDVRTFEESFFKWRYFYQAQMYAEILRQNIANDPYFRNFEILPYKFIAIDKYLVTPIVFIYNNTFSKADVYTPDGWVKNWRSALELLTWHLKHPEVKLSKSQYLELKSTGHITIRNLTPIVNEEWADIKGYEELYSISNLGRVMRKERKVWSTRNNSFSTIPEKILTPESDNSGYLKVRLTGNSNYEKFFVHRLVAEAFIDNPNNYPMVNHKDCDPKNNAYYNLEWCTAEYNSNYNIRNALISDSLGRAVERYSLEGEFIDAFDSAADACRKLGWPPNRQSNISAVCRGVRKSTLGYMWKFKEES